MSNQDNSIIETLKVNGVRPVHFGFQANSYSMIEEIPVVKLKAMVAQKVPYVDWEKIAADKNYAATVARAIWSE